jgi:hypothetical protein
MTGTGSFMVLSGAVFLGAFVSGFAGFAFSAVAGGILLHTLRPIEAVPLMMACSVGVHATNLWALRRKIEWKQSLLLVLGGILGGADRHLAVANHRCSNVSGSVWRHGSDCARNPFEGAQGQPHCLCEKAIACYWIA